ncbi:MAG: phosphatase PAP2 family protein [bacterium]
MLDVLSQWDQAIFAFLNVTLANPVTDLIMPVVTSDNLLRLGYAVAMLLLLWKGDRRMRRLVLFSAVALLITDQVSAHLLKPFFERPRPCHIMEEINLLVNCGGGYAMPSSHAANAFGQATLFALSYRQWRWYLWVFASVVAISRVFVGVHYPGDVLAGAALGIGTGWMVFALATVWLSKMHPRRENQKHGV